MNLSYKIILLFLFILGCVSTPGDLGYATYKTEHFTILYDDRYYTDKEIEVIGQKKEYLLDRINTNLGVRFNDIITAYLYYKDEQYAYAYNGAIYESRDYVINDDGHEIAHIVTFGELGHSENKFLLEGIAVFLEYKLSEYNVIEEYLGYQPTSSERRSDSLFIARQILENRFDYSYYSYRKAGAFLCYVSNLYGIDKLKSFYSESCKVQSADLGQVFQKIFGSALSAVESKFKKFYFPEPKDSISKMVSNLYIYKQSN
jgi:hypothetical protein